MIPLLDDYKKKHKVESSDVIKPGLDAIQAAVHKLGNPQLSQPTVHIAGTNGKGSTITMLERICQEHGLKTATFMSPCIEDVHDQIRLNGQPISTKQMDQAFVEVKSAGLSGQLTDFELLTALAFVAIKQANVDIALIESGMGGRYDSTNVVQPLVSIIPSIALEHTRFLGDTITKIANHKAGIIKKNGRVVVGAIPQEARTVVLKEAQQQQALYFELQKDFDVIENTYFEEGQCRYTSLNRSMIGAHQGENMALAIRAFHLIAATLHIPVHEHLIQQAVATSYLAGRFEKIRDNIYMDGAHNPASARKLRETLEKEFPQVAICFIIGMLKDKDVKGVLAELEKVAQQFIFVDIEQQQARQMPADDLLLLSHAANKTVGQDVVKIAIKQAEEQLVVITGSLYLLATWRKEFMRHKKD